MTIADSMQSSSAVAHTMTKKMGASARGMMCDISVGQRRARSGPDARFSEGLDHLVRLNGDSGAA
jgi:hypothetical protein